MAELSSTGSVETGSTQPEKSPQYSPVPIAPTKWTQGAREFDTISGYVKVSLPPRSECFFEKSGSIEIGSTAVVYVLFNGHPVGAANVNNQYHEKGGPVGETFFAGGEKFGPLSGFGFPAIEGPSIWRYGGATSTVENVTVETADNCGAKGGVATKHYVIEAVKLFISGRQVRPEDEVQRQIEVATL